jgi:F-type H+-transporting ATPase subunit b
VRSAFDLPGRAARGDPKCAQRNLLGEFHVRFETAPDLVSGIELTANGQKVAGASRIISRRWKRRRRTSERSRAQACQSHDPNRPKPEPSPKPESQSAKPKPPKPSLVLTDE